jgi:hypothetical protein
MHRLMAMVMAEAQQGSRSPTVAISSGWRGSRGRSTRATCSTAPDHQAGQLNLCPQGLLSRQPFKGWDCQLSKHQTMSGRWPVALRPGRTRTCTLRIRNGTAPVRLMLPWSIAAGRAQICRLPGRIPAGTVTTTGLPIGLPASRLAGPTSPPRPATRSWPAHRVVSRQPMPRITSYTPRRLDSSTVPGRPCRARWITLQGVPGLSTPCLVSIYCWFAWEVGLLARDLVRRKARLGPDRGTRVIVSLTLAGSIWIGILLGSWVPELDTPAPNAFAVAGVVVIWVAWPCGSRRY